MKQVKKLVKYMNSSEGAVKDKVLRSGLWLGLGSSSVRVMELFRSIILARLLPPEIFGVMGIIHLLREGINQLSATSFGDAIIYRKTEIEDCINTAWVLNILRGLLLFVLLIFLSPVIASFYGEETLNTAIKILGIVFVFEGLYNMNMILYRKNIDFKKIAILQTSTQLLGILVVIILAYYLRNVWALLIGVIFSSFIAMSLSYYIVKKKPRFSFQSKLAWELFHYGKYVTGIGLLVFLTTRLDDGLVGKVLGMKELGFYINAYFFANLPATHITAVVRQLIFPTFSHFNQDQENLNRVFLRVFKVVTAITIPASFGVLALSDEIASVLLGEIWIPMVPALKILVLFGFFRAIAGCTGPLLKAMGKPQVVFWVLLFKLIVIAIVIYPLTIRYGIEGTAIAVTGPMVLEQFYLWFLINRLTGISMQALASRLIKPALLAGVMYGLIILLKGVLPLTSFTLFFFYVLVGILIYGVGILIIDKDLVKEVKSLKAVKQHTSGEEN